MKLSQYARQPGVCYQTAHRMFQHGELEAYQLPSGMSIVNDPTLEGSTSVAIYARVSGSDQKDDLRRQIQRLRDYCAARGYTVHNEVAEIASGLNDSRIEVINETDTKDEKVKEFVRESYRQP